jgi:hypothetical protein
MPVSTTVPLDHIVAVSECSAPWWAQAGVHTDFCGRWIINGGPGRWSDSVSPRPPKHAFWA